MKNIKIVSYVLSVLMLAAVLCFGVYADDEFSLDTDYLTAKYASAEEKLATMGVIDAETGERVPNYENDEYEIWAHEDTGEVGIKVKATGQIILTNPYDISESTANEAVKQKLLSQIILQYKDSSGAVVEFCSYADAALNGKIVSGKKINQIKVLNTRSGIRIEYTLGKEQAKYVVPKQIERSSFIENLVNKWEDKSTRDYAQFMAYYDLKDPADKTLAPTVLNSMKEQFPATEKGYAIYVLDPGVSNRELEMLAGYIENNTDYDADQMAADYELIDYIDTSAAPAIFRFAIEYSVDEYGVQISMPSNSITYDSANYTLDNVKLLPYLGAGNNDNTGFTFLPDGSGTVTRFEDIKGKQFTLTGKLYGRDYTYHKIAGYTQETMRLPVVGVIENVEVAVETEADETVEEAVVEETVAEEAAAEEAVAEEVAAEETEAVEEAAAEETTEEAEATEEAETVEETEAAEEVVEEVVEETKPAKKAETKTVGQGFVAYYTEGASLLQLSSDHGGTIHNYSSVYATFYPRATDTYSLTGISSSGDAEWSVSSDRRYVGDYSLRLFPIYGEDVDYTDMAVAIRDYLEATEVLTRLNPEDENENVPLYVENFGTIKTDEKFIGFPVKRQTPLTTFEQTQAIIDELSENGISNINVKLTGWYNGGMQHTAPSTISVPSKIGGMSGLKDLAEYAKSKNVGLYPDLDFTYVEKFKSFDGISEKEDTAKTIDGRKAVHREYNPLYQGFEADDKALLSAGSITELYEKADKKFDKIGANGISLATIGYDLNSNYYEDYVINRDDAEQLTEEFLEAVKAANDSVMVDGGNAYALKYADHILDIPLDSSMNINTSISVPFMGMVLHGYTEFAGSPINLDGDYEYSVLKAIENGANLYFLVSKENTSKLKAFPEFSKYYAISYDNWKNDIITSYNSFNEVMKNVKYSLITEHEYIGTRLVRVKYDNGTEFILNYNTHEVTTEDGTTVEAMSFTVR